MNAIVHIITHRISVPLLVAGLLVSGLAAERANAQEPLAYIDYVRSDLDWYTIETDHFLVHYHATEDGEGSRTARVVSRIAEDVYEPITELYDLRLDTKVSFVLKDYEDYSNGAAYFFDNVIEIWAPALQTPFRGDHNWLRNVITHEFTHMVQVQKTMKASRRLPFVYLQYLDYETVRRPDVLYGFPNIIASYPMPVLNNPAWLAEGTAQFQRADLDYDRWDAHRDMLLRTEVLDGRQHDLVEMGGFYSHNSMMRESVYNHGFAFSRYIADRFGEEGLQKISAALGQWGNWNFKQAAKDAFGIRGEELYADWMALLDTWYHEHAPDESSAVLIEKEGFHNYWPTLSPDGKTLAYVSNRGEDYSRSGIWLKELDDPSTARLLLGEDDLGLLSGYTCSLGHKLVSSVAGSVSWSADGASIIFPRTRDTSEGYLVLDLYRVNIETTEKERLTRGLRASSPKVSPDGSRMVFVTQGDGTTNLAMASIPEPGAEPIDASAVSELTFFSDGTQVTDPVWSPDGQWVYFGRSRDHGRDIHRVHVSDGVIESVLDGPQDDRNPSFDPLGRLIFSSDRSGIYNLYRLEEDGTVNALSNERGGAFMGQSTSDGRIVYSRFTSEGYKIASIMAPVASVTPTPYEPPPFLSRFDQSTNPDSLPGSPGDSDSDADVRAFTSEEFEAQSVSYDPVFTSFSFFPVLRVDQYVSRKRSRMDVRLKDRTRGETVWRNTKFGMYASTREVLGGMSFFGGMLVGPGSSDAESLGDFFSPSNLLDMERDAFLQVDYSRGLPFLSGRWSPHLSAQVFNIRRSVENGLNIEEFPCTACYPETTYSDLSYNLWEVDFRARSKISRVLLGEVGYRYSPYRVKTKGFFSRELQQSVPSSSSRYFIGRAWTARMTFESFSAHRNMDVIPEGLRAELEFDTEQGRLLNTFDVEDGVLQPVYETSRVNRLSLNARGGFKLGDWRGSGTHGVGYRMRASTILGKEKDDFYGDYVGGLTGARGYPFYALGGNETLWAQASWIVPLVTHANRHAFFTYLDKVYLRLYADAAMAWSGEWPGMSSAKKDVGAEIRFGIESFYLLPTALFVSATYGLDQFDFELDEGFVTPDGERSVSYGHDWQWHLGLLFGFDQF